MKSPLLSLLLFILSTSAFAQSLVMHLPFSGNANDVTANANNGTVYNATLTTDRLGNANSAYQFNGSNAYIEVPDAPSLRPASLTMSCWLKMANASGLQVFAGKTPLNHSWDPYGLYLYNGQINAIAANPGANQLVNIASSAFPTPGIWFQLVETFDDAGNVQQMYFNGVSVAINTSANFSLGYDAGPFVIGRDIENGSPGFYMNGSIDEVEVYDYAMTAAQVLALYNSEAPPPPPPSTISSISPASGHAGASATVTGTNLNTGTVTVTVGGIAATNVSVLSATQISFNTPVTGTGGNQAVVVTVGGQPSTGTVTYGYLLWNIHSVVSGLWHNASTWDCNCVPNPNDTITIGTGHTITEDCYCPHTVSGVTVINGTLNATYGFMATSTAKVSGTGTLEGTNCNCTTVVINTSDYSVQNTNNNMQFNQPVSIQNYTANTNGGGLYGATVTINGTLTYVVNPGFQGIWAPLVIAPGATMNLSSVYPNGNSLIRNGMVNNGTVNMISGAGMDGNNGSGANPTIVNNGAWNQNINCVYTHFLFENNGAFNMNGTGLSDMVSSNPSFQSTFHNHVGGTLTVTSGTLKMGPFTNAGTVKGNGTLEYSAAVTNTGHFAPGLSPGTMDIVGNFTNAVLDMEIVAGTPVQKDSLHITGNLVLTGSTLNVTAAQCPADGSYDLITYTGTRTDNFTNLTLPSGHTITYDDGAKKVVLVVDGCVIDPDNDGDNFTVNEGDCDDNDPDEFPGQTWYIDADGDDYGGAAVTQCLRPTNGYLLSELVAGSTGTDDCNDNCATCHPAATEICNDGLDNDCNGQTDGGPDFAALMALYNSTDGPNWTYNMGWADGAAGTNCDVCGWYGVDCDGNGRVSSIVMQTNNLTGPLPTELGNLSQLTQLELGVNQLSGIIPASLENLSHLEQLGLGANQLTGTIPTFLGNLSNLQSILLYSNLLEGNIPLSLGGLSNLAELNLASNQLIGSIPPELGDLTNLNSLEMDGNLLSGNIPLELGSLSNLASLNLAHNQLIGNIPLELGNLTNLLNLYLNDNQLSGCFPSNLTNLCSIDCDFSNNPSLHLNGDFAAFCNNGAGGCGTDADGDGFSFPNDCDDTNINEYPGQTWYVDSDGDDYGGSSVTQCSRPTNGYLLSELASGSTGTDDCNDGNSAIHPGATEICDGLDNDCDSQTDEGVLLTFFADTDGDGYGNAAATSQACSAPVGYVSNNTDCNDNCAACHPGATETCNGADDDCDGQTDEGVLLTFYADADGDSYGNAAATTQACSAPVGYVSNSIDCNDNPATGGANEHPGQTWYLDADSDNYGASSVTQCARPTNGKLLSELVSGSTGTDDCNDNCATCNPAATEICDNLDNDCDGQTDEGVTITFYADTDGDGYGNAAATTQACSAPSGYVANSTDCNDNCAACHPGATEICDNLDNDCDGQTDEGVLLTFYADTDGDGYGNAAATTQACSAPSGYVANSTDCNDNCAACHPVATEICDNLDNDCDGQTDEGVTITFYADTDGDGYGNAAATTQACSAPSGYVANSTDCNDNCAVCYPGATEVCNGVDDDCDGQTDENLPQHPDYAALMALYNATDGANWTNHTGWGTTSCDVCGWHAVNCTDGRVTQLYLDSHNLVGALPAEIGNLTALRYIGMQNNHLSGPIPTTIGNLVNLSGLDLNSNQLSGTIPASIGNIPTLLGLGLSNNLLTGSLPPELSNLTNLVSFGLYNNQLSGCIPASYSAFCTSGTGVYIGANAGLPGGGDFAAFCANGTGQCPTDMDGDGYSTPDDCDDTNDDIYPGATEICNGADDDCDGQTDEGFPQTWTGATSTDWNIGSNWCSGHVPLATEDVIIPDVTNDPVIMGGTAAVAQSVTVNVGGLLTVTATGSLTINGSTAQGILNQGTVENGGLIVIGSTLSVGVLGIWNQGTFNNNTGSEIRIDRSTGWGVYNDSGIFTNFAKISIGSTSSVGYDGIRNQGTFHNNAGGEIRIGRSTSRGLYNSLGTFTNSAKIIIGAVASVGNYGVDNDAVFNNNADGEINIDRTSSAGLRNYFSTFNNAGEITIGAVASVGTNGVENRATFNNNTGGDISIERSSSSGLYNYLGTFTNSAKITIGAVASVGNYGLNNQGTFNNNTEGNISIDRSSVWGLLNILGTFDNNACATILLIGRLYNQQATFTNSGLFTVNTAQGHQNSAPLTNNGILSYPQGNPIPNVTNNDLVAAPITGAAVIANALQKGGALSFTAAGTWYSDPLLTTLAGSYNQAANTFTPVNSLPQCTNNTLYFNVTDAVNGCTRVASIRVNYDATAPMLTCPANRTVNLNTNCQASLANYTSLATVSDNCTAVASIARAQSPGTGNTVSGVGITVMTITATDMVGNSATCVFNVTHADVILPSIACPTTQTLQLGASCTGNLPNYASMATAADNCTPVASITKTQVTPLPGTVVTGVGLTTVTLRATDASGRSRTCNFSVQRLCGTGPETPSTAQVRADHLGEALSALAFDLEMFPNPTEGLVRLVLHGELKGESEVTVFDAMGRSVWRKRLSTEHNAATLDLSEEQYMAGLYFVVVRSNGATLTKRLVKAY